MANDRCPNCGARLRIFDNDNGTTSEECQYCGYKHENAPETMRDLAFSLVNRALNEFGVTDKNFLPISGKTANSKPPTKYERTLKALKLQDRAVTLKQSNTMKK